MATITDAQVKALGRQILCDQTPAMSVHGERILLVGDEPGVLQLVGSQLSGLGYKVEAVGTGLDA